MEKPASVPLIEVTVISAEGLLLNKKQPVKEKTFVLVRSDPFISRSTGMGTHPEWNQKLVMELPPHARFLTVEVHSGTKIVGTANIPVSDFVGGFLPENYLSFLSYRLRDANGEKNGIVNLSVKVKEAAGRSGGAAVGRSGRTWGGVPVDGGKVSDHGIAMGIPVSYTY
ncbi:UNVERIFIED_CONTAM: hypothetical protein Slati_0363000 [Sesamum latifolium]|uniref:C2 domain-containing protein n=1 Tax=Sesamum latifolium TaxID=2727402 RepID=A0AAW2YG59_9LAMI